MEFDKILEIKPYSLDREEKLKMLTEREAELTRHHYENCEEYPNGAICDRVLSTVEKYRAKKKISLDDLTNESFTKGGLNKNMDLSSCEEVITEEKSNLGEELRKLDEACDKNPKTYGCQNR